MVKKRRHSTGSSSCVCAVEQPTAEDAPPLPPAASLARPPLPRSAATRPPREPRKRSNRSESLWFLFLIASNLTHQPHLPTADLKYALVSAPMTAQPPHAVRTLFDPMIGEFDTSPEVLNAFFNSKMRWRNDEELAQFAWNQKPLDVHVNMMIAQQPPIIHGTTATNGTPAAAHPAMANGQPADPSLIDYEAIDVYWRHDIEMEKGVPLDVHPIHYANGQGCSSSSADVSNEQFERDLQLLKEKQLLQPLTHEENFRYENLSKCHYADFYRAVPPAASKRWESAAASSSSGGFSNATADLQFRPASPAKSNITSFSNFDESEAADFFSNLAKQSLLEEAAIASANQPPAFQPYSNFTLCADQSGLLNNASLAPTAPTDTFELLSNNTHFAPSGGLRGSGVENVKQEAEEADDHEQLFAAFDFNPPMPIPEEEAHAAMQNLQYNEDLDEALHLREFMSMEILGEFQHVPQLGEKRMDSPIPETLLTSLPYRNSSPSSGIGSMQSSSSSPNHFEEEGSNDAFGFRFDNKLAPRLHDFSGLDGGHKLHGGPKDSKIPLQMDGGVEQRKRGRQSKDEALAQEHNLPASAEEFAAMSHMEIQAYMRDPTLTPAQKTLIKKIRRRGRNKIAAQKCRQRRFADNASVYKGY
ncbi:BZIP domain-containing protein [Aphelenchoides fujianensis]|nr:BZIP domain-containing protein [Aphelenchoides fujianensis]